MPIRLHPGITVPHLATAQVTERMWAVLLVVLVAIVLVQMRHRVRLSFTALTAIASFSIWWQESYSNWGLYLLYAPEFHLMPWRLTWWTSPNKPWFLLAAYPVFMTATFSAVIAVIRWAKRRRPRTGLLRLAILVAPPLFALSDVLFDAASVRSGARVYQYATGPIVPLAHGFQPLLWPALPFALFGTMMCCLLLIQTAPGHPAFERRFRSARLRPGLGREATRALAWVVTWNLLYWVLVITPVDLLRQLHGPSSTLVP